MPTCIFKKCKNHSQKRNKSDGISYFHFPQDGMQRERWRKIVAQERGEEFFTANHANVVCSDHFVESDKYITKKGLQRIKKSAIPHIKSVEIELNDSLLACRACLATDGRLYAISGSGLEHTLAALTGKALPMDHSLPRHLCVFCKAMLSKCAAFRDSCQRSTALLNNLSEKGQLEINVIEAYHRKSQHLTNQLTCNKVFQFDTDSFIDLVPLIKTENNEYSNEEAEYAEVCIKSENDVKKDASDVDYCTLELPIENRERSKSDVVKSRAENIDYIRVEEEIENHNANLEIDDFLESEVKNITIVDMNVSTETIATVRNRKRTSVHLTNTNTAKRPKQCGNLLTEVDKHPTQINTDASKATIVAGPRKRMGIKSADTELAFGKKSNRNTKVLNTAQKQSEKRKYKRAIHSCDICGREYKRRITLERHMRRHGPNMSKEAFATLKKDHDLDFEKKYNFKIKLLSKEEQKQRIEERKMSNSACSCDLCGKEYQQESTLAAHKASCHDPSLPVGCDVCFYRFQSKRQLRRHQQLDRHRYVFTCNECGYAFRNRMHAKDHSLMHQGQTLCCPYCDMKYNRQSSYYTHIREQHPGKNEACDECGETFKGKVGLMVHKGMRHKTNDKANENLKCSVCEVTFLNAEALQRHVELSAGVPHAALWACAACGDTTGSEPALAAHAAEKHQHYCEECNKTFSDAASFALHVERKHKNQRRTELARRGQHRQYRQQDQHKRIVCEICGKVLLCMATLRYHMNGHLGLCPYQCSHCPKAFPDKTRLKSHMQVHTGEKPYQCEQCPMAFAFKGNLNRHIKIVHLRLQAECATCGKTMGVESLRPHIRAVHMNQRQVRRKRTRTKKPALATDS